MEQLNQDPDFFQVKHDVFEVNLILKKGSQSCGIDAIPASGATVKDSILSYGAWSFGIAPEVLGVNKFNCSSLNIEIDVGFKNNVDEYANFFNATIKPDSKNIFISWDINLTVPMLAYNTEQPQDTQDEAGKPPIMEIKPLLKEYLQGPERTDCGNAPN